MITMEPKPVQPVIYTLYEIKKPKDYDLNGRLETKGFIVSPAFLVGDENIVRANGETKHIYKVVYPFPNIFDFRKKQTPDYIGQTEGYSNSSIVDDIFYDLETAQIMADKKNKELIMDKISTYPIKDIMSGKLKMIFEEEIEYYQKKGEVLALKTRDLVICSKKGVQKKLGRAK